MCSPSLLESQRQETTTRRGCSQSSGTSIDSKLASTAGTNPVASESGPLIKPVLAAQVVDDNQDWEIRDVIGKEVVNGRGLLLGGLVPNTGLWTLTRKCKGAVGRV
jgi:hypothetical protein